MQRRHVCRHQQHHLNSSDTGTDADNVLEANVTFRGGFGITGARIEYHQLFQNQLLPLFAVVPFCGRQCCSRAYSRPK